MNFSFVVSTKDIGWETFRFTFLVYKVVGGYSNIMKVTFFINVLIVNLLFWNYKFTSNLREAF